MRPPTRFVSPGASGMPSTANTSVPNVAWRNPDGSKALIAYNDSGATQSIKVNWGAQSFVYTLPAQTTATFTWSGTTTGQITGIGGKCVDVAAANSANGTAVRPYCSTGHVSPQRTRG